MAMTHGPNTCPQTYKKKWIVSRQKKKTQLELVQEHMQLSATLSAMMKKNGLYDMCTVYQGIDHVIW